MSKNIDIISLEITWNNLKSIADESYITLMKSAFSTNIKERHDHSTAITNSKGKLIAQAENALPAHLASMGGLIQHVIDEYGENIFEGDIFIANDPHVAGGTHLPDINMAMPIFSKNQLMGFVANIVHHADVGGAAVGSMSGGLNEIYKEGLRIPLVRLYNKGKIVNDVFRLLLLNMRLSDERKGDLNAQISACRLGVKRVKELISKHDEVYLNNTFEEILKRSKIRMQAAISKIPDGDYSFTDYMDDDGLNTKNIKISVTIKKKGKKILFDFSDTDEQVEGNFNLTFNATQSSVCYSLKALLDPDLPNNSGIFDAIEIKIPKGSLLNCLSPASVALRLNTCQRVVDVVLGAFIDILPKQITGAANGANTSAVFAGINPNNGQRYVYLETLGGGMGGRYSKDGKDGVQVHLTNTSNLPVEAIEMEYPLRVEEYSFVENSGGAGKYRGGLGIRRIIRPIAHKCEFSGVGERFKHSPWGVFGGKPGKPGKFFIKHKNGKITKLSSKSSSIYTTEKDAIIMETPGAGGYGDPKKRSKENLLKDKISGKFSNSFIKKYY
ncbi:MAG: hydantoinase B/oxoprolinase family protein [Candidatus Puniceispirillales bacterium]|tara:strand:- start:1082 stop:2746 length:1665 start_codon:yes stop_codon:yes gene_type:complete